MKRTLRLIVFGVLFGIVEFIILFLDDYSLLGTGTITEALRRAFLLMMLSETAG